MVSALRTEKPEAAADDHHILAPELLYGEAVPQGASDADDLSGLHSVKLLS